MKIQPPETATTTALSLSRRIWTVQTALGFALITFIWRSFAVAAQVGVQSIPPLLLGGLRFTLAGAILLAILLVRREKVLLPRGQLLKVLRPFARNNIIS